MDGQMNSLGPCLGSYPYYSHGVLMPIVPGTIKGQADAMGLDSYLESRWYLRANLGGLYCHLGPW